MHRFCLVGLLAACSSGRAADPPIPSATPTARALASLLPDAVVGITRFEHGSFVLAEYLGNQGGARRTPCWTKLERGLVAGYQLELAGHQSLFVLEGDLPRAAVEACVPGAVATMLPGVTVAHDGELAVFELGRAGTAYAAWAPPYIVVGRRAEVAAAVATRPDSEAWAKRLAGLPKAPMVSLRTDLMIANMLGVPTSDYDLIMEQLKPAYRGRLSVHYASAADATTAAKHLAEAEFHFAAPPPEKLATALSRMSTRVSGSILEIGFDFATFDSVTMAELEKWVTQMRATPTRP